MRGLASEVEAIDFATLFWRLRYGWVHKKSYIQAINFGIWEGHPFISIDFIRNS